MTVMYATAAELAIYLQQEVSTPAAELALRVTSQLFSTRAGTMFTPTAETWQEEVHGEPKIRLPFSPLIDVAEVRIVNAGGITVLTGWTRIKSVLYSAAGFGARCLFPPDMIEVDVTHGYAECPDDVRGAILESAGAAYLGPDITVAAEAIDDYSVKMAANTGGVSLSVAAATLADLYRGTLAA